MKMTATHEVRKYLEGCEGSGKIVATGSEAECLAAQKRLEAKSADCYSFSIFEIDGTPDGSQYTYDQDGAKVHQPGF